MSHRPLENIPGAHHSMAANPVCKHFILWGKKDSFQPFHRYFSLSCSASVIYFTWQKPDSPHLKLKPVTVDVMLFVPIQLLQQQSQNIIILILSHCVDNNIWI